VIRLLPIVLLCSVAQCATLTYTSAPALNPMKGFVPFHSTPGRTTFPKSLQFTYFSLRQLMTGPSTFVWTDIDTEITAITNENCQCVFRVYIDFPGNSTGIPQYLLDGGLTTFNYSVYGNTTSVSPNWEDANLRTAMTNFITALGARYDNDPRIAVMQVGLLGFYAEWHDETVPFASFTVQDEVMRAYSNAFPHTLMTMRTASTTNAAGPFGYHDDGFCEDTLLGSLPNGFMITLTNAGALTKWQTNILGGEVFPSYWYCLFDSPSCPPAYAYNTCVDTTHVSWLMDSGAFSTGTPMNDPERAATMTGAQRMGYELHVPSWSFSGSSLTVTITNTGVAPFYYPWTVQAVVGTATSTVPFNITKILPGASTNVTTAFSGLSNGVLAASMRVINPMAGGTVLSFANTTQDTNTGWLSLGNITTGGGGGVAGNTTAQNLKLINGVLR